MPRSILWRLLLWNGVLLAAVVTILLVAFYRHEHTAALQRIDVALRQNLQRILPELDAAVPGLDGPDRAPPPRPRDDDFGDDTPRRNEPEEPPPPGPHRRRGAGKNALRDLETDGFWCLMLFPDGTPAYRAGNAPPGIPAPLAETWQKNAGVEKVDETTLSADGRRLLLHRHPGGRYVVVGAPLAPLESAMPALALKLALTGLAIVGLGIGVGRVLVARTLRPIARISAVAERISGGDFGSRVNDTETESELGRLAAVLNTTFDSVEKAREQLLLFTADASHELRTPLCVILANCSGALNRERSGAEYREALESVERAARRMKTLSDDLLELARGGAGKETLQAFPCDLADLADEAASMLAPLAKEHGALIETRLESCPIDADPVRLGRVVVNLISNAILHNEPGVAITVIARVEDDRAVLEIVDTGKGIPSKHLGKIFDRFHRADASRSRHTGGSGLGLAIVKQTVELHGGAITVKSAVGAGSTFTISLPVRR